MDGWWNFNKNFTGFVCKYSAISLVSTLKKLSNYNWVLSKVWHHHNLWWLQRIHSDVTFIEMFVSSVFNEKGKKCPEHFDTFKNVSLNFKEQFSSNHNVWFASDSLWPATWGCSVCNTFERCLDYRIIYALCKSLKFLTMPNWHVQIFSDSR